MKIILIMERRGDWFKTSSKTPKTDLPLLLADPAGYQKDKDKVAESMVAMAMGLHHSPKELFATFNLVTKD